jgi:hypothetical protein
LKVIHFLGIPILIGIFRNFWPVTFFFWWYYCLNSGPHVLLYRYSTTWTMYPYFLFSYVLGRVLQLCLELASVHNLLIYASQVVMVTGVHHHVQVVCWDGILLTSCLAGHKLSPPDLCHPSSWEYKCEPPSQARFCNF